MLPIRATIAGSGSIRPVFAMSSIRWPSLNGCYRIVVLGDSITAGVGIEDLDAVFTRRLEGLLNDDGEAVSFEVINLGVGGYHTLQEAETLLVSGLRYQPDHVVVAFCVNDIAWDADGQVLEELRSQLRPGQQSVLLTGWRSSNWTSGLLSKSRLCFFAYHRASSLETVPGTGVAA